MNYKVRHIDGYEVYSPVKKSEGRWIIVFITLMISAAFFLKEVAELLVQYMDLIA